MMKNQFMTFAALATAFAVSSTAFAADKTKKAPASAPAAVGDAYTLDTAESTLTWTGTKKTGDSHTGTVQLKSGELVSGKNGALTGKFTIDMNSLVNTDVSDPGYNKKLVDHLHSDDFFSTKKFPEATFTLTGAKPLANAKDGNTHEITGDMTIKGITHPVTFPAKVRITLTDATAEGVAKLDRTKWNVKYNSSKFFSAKKLGDKIINDEFDVAMKLAAHKK